MAGVVVHRKLPALAKVLGSPRAEENKSRQLVITEQLREAAQLLRTAEAQPFYAMREVAGFFQAPLGTIALVYQLLEREGILNRIRSSRTMLAGRQAVAREAIRGVVGISTLMRSITNLVYTQQFVSELEERLRRAGFVADIVFHFREGEDAQPEFAERLLSHRLDAIILHTPPSKARQTILSLREGGMRVLTLQREEAPRDLPTIIYLLNYGAAYRQMAARWHSLGIRKVWLWTMVQQLTYATEADTFSSIMEEAGIEVETLWDEPAELLRKIKRYKKAPTAVAFLETFGADEVCNCHPLELQEIAKNARLAFCVAPIRAPYLSCQKVRADIVQTSPSEIAARLASDIGQLSVISDGLRHTFEAQYHEQVCL